MNQTIDSSIVDLEPLRLRHQGPCVQVDIPPLGKDLEVLVQASRRLADYLEDHPSARVVVFNGVSGEPETTPPPLDLSRRWEKTLTRLARLAAVTIAAVDGPCEGFGLQLALSCDYRLATARSSFRSPEITAGYLPGMLTFRVAKFVGLGLARRMLFTGAPLDAARAHRAGLIDELCANGELEGAVQAFASSLRDIDPVAIQLGRRLLEESYASTHEDAIGHLLAAQHRCLSNAQSK